MSEGDEQDRWVGRAEGRRRGSILRGLGLLAAALAALFAASHGHVGSDGVTALVVVASCLLAVAVVVGFAVRPRSTPAGTAFVTLTPVGVVSANALRVTNPDQTLAGRLVIAPGGVAWDSRRSGHLRWSRGDVAGVQIRRVASFRPLGYVTIARVDGTSFTARIFQPRQIEAAFAACGYPRRPAR